MRLYLFVSLIASVAITWIIGPWGHAPCSVFYRIGEISATLFAVIGVWLALAYRDEIITNMWRGKGDDQQQAANLVKVAYGRCEMLFRGFKISTIAFVISFAIALSLPWWMKCAHGWNFKYASNLILVCRYGLTCACAYLCCMQLYALFVCVSPMKDIVDELRKAKDTADRILANAKAAG